MVNVTCCMRFESLHHVAISVSDLARAKEFYGDVLGLEEIARPDFRSTARGIASADHEVHLIVSRDPSFRTARA